MKFAIPTLLLAIVSLTTSSAMAQHEAMTVDQIRIAVQQICPVSGLKLGAHGDPVKAKIGKMEFFLCCEGCIGKKVKKEHWATIHKNFAKAQGKCVVMQDNPLPAKPKWTIANGRMFYVCCPPCIEKIDADPESYSKKLDGLYGQWVHEQQKQ